ncbi:Catechol 2,3-dioxygenase [Celeribacter baekdonensis]|uniref:Catechol 2,3-dioxygenase n=1 Tax=Celeribacter baekdonensis TaxID=875171 RepID=A0A1G7IRN8_9RHOB|nr:VOC family protein [Celeribacter baekdonensis]SDF15246.1 Catechol 2,3-dioxygenase [Celeribacter baekdonensis]
MRLLHVSLTARDAEALAKFYKQVFGFVDRRTPMRLFGENVSRGNGLPDSNIYSIWLNLPDDDGPFLEIMEFDEAIERHMPAVNEPGYAHIAFEVRDLQASTDEVLKCGGSLLGEVTNFGTHEHPHLIVYLRDPEGNILELEQPFSGEKPKA